MKHRECLPLYKRYRQSIGLAQPSRCRDSAFTLVEVMIVVVLIGLLASMAIPFFRKTREATLLRTLLNDSRQIAGAAQQYFTENLPGSTTVAIGVNTVTGALSGELSVYVKKISRGTEVGDYNGAVASGGYAFTMRNASLYEGAVMRFDSEGKVLP